MAVDGVPATKYFAAAGLEPQSLPSAITVPSARSWGRLIVWLLELGVGLPAGSLPDVVTLYTNWSLTLGGRDALTPVIVQWLYHWLSEIMDAARSEPPRRAFDGELAGRLGALAEDLNTGFLLFCNHAPGLAAAYLEALKQQPFPDRVREEILKFRGSLAQAAPKELAELTAEVLIPTEEEEENTGVVRCPTRSAMPISIRTGLSSTRTVPRTSCSCAPAWAAAHSKARGSRRQILHAQP